jgi:hypothetical protein
VRNSVSSVMSRDDLNDFHSFTHLLVISNMEEEPSVRLQSRRLDGLKIRSEHGGEEENRIESFSPWLITLFTM